MGVDTAVFAQARRVPRDVADPRIRLAEGGGQQQRPGLGDQVLPDGLHTRGRPVRRSHVTQDGPGLGVEEDAGDVVPSTAQFRAVVQCGADVPVPIPAVFVDRANQRRSPLSEIERLSIRTDATEYLRPVG